MFFSWFYKSYIKATSYSKQQKQISNKLICFGERWKKRQNNVLRNHFAHFACEVSKLCSSLNSYITVSVQGQPAGMFYTKGTLKSFAKFKGKHLHQSLFFNKVLWHRCFPVSFTKSFRTPFLQNTGRLFLPVVKRICWHLT